jgi:hypothetical protein
MRVMDIWSIKHGGLVMTDVLKDSLSNKQDDVVHEKGPQGHFVQQAGGCCP